jgi:hypothetical protein
MLLSGSWLKDRMPTSDASSSQPVSKELHADLPHFILSLTSTSLDIGIKGFQSTQLIIEAGLDLGDVSQFPVIDVTIDGADECVEASPPISHCLRS